MEYMANSTIINGTQLVKDNMPVQPENIILIIGVFFGISMLVVFGFWLWSVINK
jgi:hypothetical protein